MNTLTQATTDLSSFGVSRDIYSANGNIIGVVLLRPQHSEAHNYRNSASFRSELVAWGQENTLDSIMVLSSNPELLGINGLHLFMDVFEPNAITPTDEVGGWSSMCGNGLMAVAFFYEQHINSLSLNDSIIINTHSGLRPVTKIGSASYEVCMGEFTFSTDHLKRYVNIPNTEDSYELIDSLIPSALNIRFCNHFSIGFSGDFTSNPDGEPHAVVISENQYMTLPKLIAQAVSEGPTITKNLDLFPNEINTDFAVIKTIDRADHIIDVLGATHERGLGNDPERSVTGACGTGATAIAATIYEQCELTDKYLIRIVMPSGTLRVYRDRGQYYLIGQVAQL